MKRNLLLLCITVICIFILSNCKKDDPMPVANFTADKTTAMANAPITFTNTTTNATSYSWSFGDGNSSSEKSPVHSYTSGGQFSVTLTATGKGGANVKSITVTILPSVDGEWSISLTPTNGDKLDGNMFINQKENNMLTGAIVLNQYLGSLLLPSSNISGSTVVIESKFPTSDGTNIYILTYTFNGTITSTNSMNGTYSIENSLQGSWTASKISGKKAATNISDFLKGKITSGKSLNLVH